ncbi:MAG: glucuronate isomerase [Brevinemataceae bacterium]
MKTFITDNFLLNNKYAEQLYHNFAQHMPIIDYHCHLSPKEIAQDKKYRSITELWLDGDHYKWRAIRSAGFEEKEVTGYIGNPEYDYHRFETWAKVLPKTLGNPLYHWTHLELLRYFNIDLLLTPETAKEIYHQSNNVISQDNFSARALIKKFNLKFIGTTDDPIDSLEYHQTIKESGFECEVAPSWRPDKIVKIDMPGFGSYIKELAEVSSIDIVNISGLMEAISKRIDHFKAMGCSISDHGLDHFVFTKQYTESEVNTIFINALQSKKVSSEDVIKYKSFVLVEMGKIYARNNWVMQLHIGALRNNNTKLFQLLGSDIGCDSINDFCYASELSSFLDVLNLQDMLPKTILYSLNPRDNEMLGTMIGNFQGSIPGKIQLGSGWWFNDQKDGMERQLIALSSLGLLAEFVGMLTDSRSFLSFCRHEYFRRILCNILGTWMAEGQIPSDINFVGNVVSDICFNNANRYFNLI